MKIWSCADKNAHVHKPQFLVKREDRGNPNKEMKLLFRHRHHRSFEIVEASWGRLRDCPARPSLPSKTKIAQHLNVWRTKLAQLWDGSFANWSRPQVNKKNCHNVPHKSIVIKEKVIQKEHLFRVPTVKKLLLYF